MSSFLSFLSNSLSPVSTFHTCMDIQHPQDMGYLIVPIPSKKNASLSFSIYQLPKPSGDWVEPQNSHKLLSSLCQNFGWVDFVCVLCTQLQLSCVHKHSGPEDSFAQHCTALHSLCIRALTTSSLCGCLGAGICVRVGGGVIKMEFRNKSSQ